VNRTTDRALIFGTAMTRTIGWNTLFVPFALMVQPMEATLGWSRAEINVAFTLGILISGVVARCGSVSCYSVSVPITGSPAG